MASIIAFTLNAAGNPSPYYHEVTEGFLIPAAYFPMPMIDSAGDTFMTHALDYAWYVKFFAKTTPLAQRMGQDALTLVRRKRNLIPLVDENGEITQGFVRLADPRLKKIDMGVAELTLRWTERQPYDEKEAELMAKRFLAFRSKGG